MTEWAYKATAKMASEVHTTSLVCGDGFICKAAYEGGGARADHVLDVHVGDLIHFYFRPPRTRATVAHVIGSFEVVVPSNSKRFVHPVAGTDLVEVVDPAFSQRVMAMGYGTDPKLQVVTGWVVRSAGVQTPTHVRSWFPGNHVLRRLAQPVARAGGAGSQ